MSFFNSFGGSSSIIDLFLLLLPVTAHVARAAPAASLLEWHVKIVVIVDVTDTVVVVYK